MEQEIILKYKGGKGGKLWTMFQSIDHTLHNGEVITIPQDFETDLSSVPKILWSIFPPYGNFILAALVHDYLYIADKTRGRRFADKEMLIISNKTHKNKLDNYIRFIGVRAFGWIYFRYLDF